MQDENSVSSAGLHTDHDLYFSMGPGETWTFDVFLSVRDGGIQVAFLPLTGGNATTTLTWGGVGPAPGPSLSADNTTGNFSSVTISYPPLPSFFSILKYGTGGPQPYVIRISGTVVVSGSGAGGNVFLLWGATGGPAAVTTVQANSTLVAHRF